MNKTNLENRKVLACIEVLKRGRMTRRYALYFTEKKMIVAKTGMSLLWIPVIGVCMFLGAILLGGIFFTAIHPRYKLEPAWLVAFLGSIGLVLVFGPWSYVRWRIKRRIKKYFDAPESILMADKKNFEIAYGDISRIEMHPRGKMTPLAIAKIPKIRILTNREKHEFFVLRKKKFKDYVNLVRSILPDKLEMRTRESYSKEGLVSKQTKFCLNCGAEIDAKAKFCPKCGVDQPPIKGAVKEHSALWYLLPVFLGCFGGICGYLRLKADNPSTAKKLLILGIIVTFVLFVILPLTLIFAGIIHV